IDVARRASSLGDPAFLRDLATLRARELASRVVLMRDLDALHARLDPVVLPSIGARRDPELRLLPTPPREGLARHAAAVALAFAVATSASACKKPAVSPPDANVDAAPLTAVDAGTDAALAEPPDATPPDAAPPDSGPSDSGTPAKPKPKPKIREHRGISEFAAPPLDRRNM
ncbi:MAG TPA: hypothetical protein VIF62_01385, partial [Labilithrix sp.]